jgi:O-antigen ligase
MDAVAAPEGGSLTTVADLADPDLSVAPTTTDEREPTGEDLARPAAVLVALLACTIPLADATALWSSPGGSQDWNRTVLFAPFDLVLVAIVAWTALHLRVLLGLLRRRAVQVASALYATWFVASFAANPSWLGLALAWRLGAGLAVIALVSEAFARADTRRLLLIAITAAGVLQAVLAMVQSARGEAFAIAYLDFAGPLYPFGSSRAGRGGLTHPYHLAVFLVMAQGAALLGLRHASRPTHRRRAFVPWLAALAVLAAGLAVTYTRAGALGQLALVAALVLGRADRHRQLLAVAALMVGLAIGAVAFGDGWLARGEVTAGAQPGASVDSNRSERLREAQGLVEDEPLLGVGPGRYVTALAETERTEYLPAHNLVAHEAAELGIVGGIAAAALLVLLGLRVLRGGSWTAAIVAPMVPFLLLDAYPYVFATGLAISAIWLGLARASLEPAARTEVPTP